eukprot:m.60003 g.60003  ORF g.60003 m.60003 type:complete len:749 (-) comp19148_c2_seq2:91-2337(-)
MEEVKKTFEQTACHPSFTDGTLIQSASSAPGSSHTVFHALVSTSQRDLQRQKKRKALQTFSLFVDFESSKANDSTAPSVVSVPTPFPNACDDLISFTTHSPTGRLAIIRAVSPAKPSANEKKEFYIEVWEKNALVKSFATSEHHGDIYEAASTFGCLQWCPEGKRLLYCAEKKQPVRKSCWEATKPEEEGDKKTTGQDSTNNSNAPQQTLTLGDDLPSELEKFQYKESYGEALSSAFDPQLWILDWESGEFSQPLKDTFPADLTVGQAVWNPDGNSIVFVGWPEQYRRLGLIYCFNRASSIYQFDLTKPQAQIERISKDPYAARSPQFSPHGTHLIWLESVIGGPHNAPSRLIECAWQEEGKPQQVLVDIVDGDVDLGIYLYRFPPRCWISRTQMVLSTAFRSERVLAFMDFDTRRLTRITSSSTGPLQFGSWQLLDVNAQHNVILAAWSSIDTPPIAVIGTMSASGNLSWSNLTPCNTIPGISWRVLEFPSDSVTWEAVLATPKDHTKKPFPLIAFPHGGPHSAFDSGYYHHVAGFVSQGYAVVLVNYRGSLSFGQKGIDSLPGKVGEQDVNDVNDAVSRVIIEGFADPNKVVVYGGSHGGLLSAHLTGQFPDRYKACVMRNPVIDVSVMAGITDIPDWCYVEAGLQYDADAMTSAASVTVREKMMQASPIMHVSTVQAPTLVLLGAKDKRVPMSQGLMWHRALKSLGVTTRVHVYAEEQHPLAGVECDGDVFVSSCMWFAKHLAEQ